MKVFFRNIHLYLGLGAGLVIAITCFTGAALVFEKELYTFIYPERYRIEAGNQRVSIEQMVSEVQRNIPGARVASVKIYDDPTRTVELNYSDKKEEGREKRNGSDHDRGSGHEKVQENRPGREAGGADQKEKKGGSERKEGGPGSTKQALVNPYTGQLVGLQSQRSPFFFTMFSLHRWLLAGVTGKLIVGISTAIFLFILITGIILWWPKNKNILQQRLTLKWNAGWKRLNHDWHIVLGFYSAIFLFAFAFTGLAWSFKWFNDGIYWITGTENKRPEPPTSTFQEGATPISFDQAYQIARNRMPQAEYYSINRPKEAEASISVTVMPKNAAHERATNQLFLDQYSGEPIGQFLYQDRNLGQRVRAIFYPIHVGSIAGLPGRIIAFLACLAGMTFPITGIIMWLNRLKKEKKKGISKKRPAVSWPAKAYKS